MAINTVFSEFEAVEIGVKPEGGSMTTFECISNVNEGSEVYAYNKKCRGMVRNNYARETGTGTVTINGHWPEVVKQVVLGRVDSNAKSGVYTSRVGAEHPYCLITIKKLDENGNIKCEAFPKAKVIGEYETEVENGQDEVPPTEMEFAYSPDEFGVGRYESSSLSESEAASWMSSFNAGTHAGVSSAAPRSLPQADV